MKMRRPFTPTNADEVLPHIWVEELTSPQLWNKYDHQPGKGMIIHVPSAEYDPRGAFYGFESQIALRGTSRKLHRHTIGTVHRIPCSDGVVVEQMYPATSSSDESQKLYMLPRGTATEKKLIHLAVATALYDEINGIDNDSRELIERESQRREEALNELARLIDPSYQPWSPMDNY